jgi:L-ascorbate metabolism protein UlaG (beta-lactamase superfamily)
MSIESLPPRDAAGDPTPIARERSAPRPRRRWLRRALLSTVVLLILCAGLLLQTTSCTASFGGSATGARLARMQASPNFANGRFHNASPTLTPPSGSQWDAMKSMLRGAPDRRPATPLSAPPRAAVLATLATPPSSGLRVTWIGHSTLLLEIDGRRFLTDPIFSDRASPSTLLGSKRFQPPAIALADLPPLDGVILSHDHYDHLDLASIRALNDRGVTFYAPLGVGAHLERWGVPAARIIEHDWWEKTTLGDLTLTATPAHHFSGRRLIDYNRTLWCSWVIAGPTHRVFFSGDSGLSAVFAEIGQRHGPFDVAFMDIGAANPSWADVHFGPKPAAAAFAMLNAKRLFPIHWATFTLAPHAWSEPAETLTAESAARGFELVTPPLGMPVEPESAAATPRWWRAVASPLAN